MVLQLDCTIVCVLQKLDKVRNDSKLESNLPWFTIVCVLQKLDKVRNDSKLEK